MSELELDKVFIKNQLRSINTSVNSVDNSLFSNKVSNLETISTGSYKEDCSDLASIDKLSINSKTTNSVVAAGYSNSFSNNNGHFFTKKTFHKPTYCHHCTEMLWGLIGQGYVCESNF